MLKKILKPGLHWLYLFIPLAVYFESIGASAPLVFFSAAISIIPVARLISQSTEQLAHRTGDAIGALLNATFGNAPELIIAVVALNAGLHEMVIASLAGAILANMLLSMGLSFLVGGIKLHEQEYNPSSIRVYSSMMLIAVISLTVPSAFHLSSGKLEIPIETENTLNISLSILLLLAYVLYLYFMIGTHSDFFKSRHVAEKGEEEEVWSVKMAISALVLASVLAAFLSEILVGSAEKTGEIMGLSDAFIGIIFLAVIGGTAESVSAILMASKNKMDLSIGIALGSSIQMALFVAPILVLLSVMIGGEQMNLNFSRAQIWSLFLSVLVGAFVAGDGRANWYKGVQLIIVYIIIAMMFFFVPSPI